MWAESASRKKLEEEIKDRRRERQKKIKKSKASQTDDSAAAFFSSSLQTFLIPRILRNKLNSCHTQLQITYFGCCASTVATRPTTQKTNKQLDRESH